MCINMLCMRNAVLLLKNGIKEWPNCSDSRKYGSQAMDVLYVFYYKIYS